MNEQNNAQVLQSSMKEPFELPRATLRSRRRRSCVSSSRPVSGTWRFPFFPFSSGPALFPFSAQTPLCLCFASCASNFFFSWSCAQKPREICQNVFRPFLLLFAAPFFAQPRKTIFFFYYTAAAILMPLTRLFFLVPDIKTAASRMAGSL